MTNFINIFKLGKAHPHADVHPKVGLKSKFWGSVHAMDELP